MSAIITAHHVSIETKAIQNLLSIFKNTKLTENRQCLQLQQLILYQLRPRPLS